MDQASQAETISMNLISSKKIPEKCLWGCLLIETIYSSYRYPFQINNSGTSPTYRDTPFLLQFLKFPIAIAFLSVSMLYLFRRPLPFRKWLFFGVVVALSLYAFLRGLLAADEKYIDMMFWTLVALVLVVASTPVKISSLNRYFRFIFICGIVSTIIMVGLFFAIGRLPALAYEHSFSVRFGGFIDDPNGFPALVFMLMGWVWFKYSGAKCFFVEALLISLVLISQSLTAIGFLVLLAFLFAITYMLLRRPVTLMTIGALFCFVVYSFWETLIDLVRTAIELRQGSIDSHLSGVTESAVTGPFDWITGGPIFSTTESWWVRAVYSMGVPWLLIIICVFAILGISILKAYRDAQTVQYKSVLAGIGMLFAFIIVGNINLPFLNIFPIQFIFYTLSFLVFFERIEDDTVVAQSPELVSDLNPAGTLQSLC